MAEPAAFGLTQGFRNKHILADDDFDAEDYDQIAEIIQRRSQGSVAHSDLGPKTPSLKYGFSGLS